MATVAAVIASTHHPFYYRASTSTGVDRPPFADEWVAKIKAFRETLTRARPDVLVMVGSDHFHQLWLDNMPQFLIGKAPAYDANWYNEEREFGLPRMFLQGQEDLSGYLLARAWLTKLSLPSDGRLLARSEDGAKEILFQVTRGQRHSAFRIERVEGVPPARLESLYFEMNAAPSVRVLDLDYMTLVDNRTDGVRVEWPEFWHRSPLDPLGGFAILRANWPRR